MSSKKEPVTKKATIYLEPDADITAIIDQVRAAKPTIVAVVPPKRIPALQSSVNLRLLQRIAKQNKKKVVLITSDSALTALAGVAQLYVAKTLSSKPMLPPTPDADAAVETLDAPSEASAADPKDAVSSEDPELDPKTPVGELAAATSTEPEVIDLDTTGDKDAKEGKRKGFRPDRKLKVPDFIRFRRRFVLAGGGVVLLIVGWFVAFWILPSATITIETDTTSITRSVDITLDSALDAPDTDNLLLPAAIEQVEKTNSQKAPATGEKNIGERATGTVSLLNCRQQDGTVDIPAGTGVSNGSQTFITAAGVTLPASVFSGGGSCLTATVDVNVTAQNPGESFNLAANTTFAVAGVSSVSGQNDAAFSGGTDEIATVVTEDDVRAATEALASSIDAEAQAELKQTLEANGLLALEESFSASEATVSVSPAVGEPGSEVTVTSTNPYSMWGVQLDQIGVIVEAAAAEEIAESQQSLLSNGLDAAAFRVQSGEAATQRRLSVTTKLLAGPEIDTAAIAEFAVGKKRGEIEAELLDRAGVSDARVSYAPFWVYSTPRSADKITVTVVEVVSDSSSE